MLYLLHFAEPLGNDRHRAQHYLGYTDDERGIEQRLHEHRSGQGARITAACNQRGITYDVARIIPGDRTRERQIKNGKNLGRFCPICSPKKR